MQIFITIKIVQVAIYNEVLIKMHVFNRKYKKCCVVQYESPALMQTFANISWLQESPRWFLMTQRIAPHWKVLKTEIIVARAANSTLWFSDPISLHCDVLKKTTRAVGLFIKSLSTHSSCYVTSLTETVFVSINGTIEIINMIMTS